MRPIDAHKLAVDLMTEYGLVRKGWTFKFDAGCRRLGCCHYRTKQITMSHAYVTLNDRANVEDTIRHEIAHALCPPAAGHGPVWQAMAVKLGAQPSPCKSAESVPPRWVGRCPTQGCSFKLTRHQLNRNAREFACSRCCRRTGGVWRREFVLVWTPNTEAAPTESRIAAATATAPCTRCFLIHAPGQTGCE